MALLPQPRMLGAQKFCTIPGSFWNLEHNMLESLSLQIPLYLHSPDRSVLGCPLWLRLDLSKLDSLPPQPTSWPTAHIAPPALTYCTPSHLHTSPPTHLHTYTPAYLHTYTPVYLHTCTPFLNLHTAHHPFLCTYSNNYVSFTPEHQNLYLVTLSLFCSTPWVFLF